MALCGAVPTWASGVDGWVTICNASSFVQALGGEEVERGSRKSWARAGRGSTKAANGSEEEEEARVRGEGARGKGEVGGVGRGGRSCGAAKASKGERVGVSSDRKEGRGWEKQGMERRTYRAAVERRLGLSVCVRWSVLDEASLHVL